MRINTWSRVCLFAAATLGGAAPASGDSQLFPESQAIAQFQRDADAYALLHRQVERRMPPLEVSADAVSIRQAIDAMAAGMRAARPNAREGELFKPPVRQVFRARIIRAMRAHELTVADLESEEGAPEAGLLVNDDMPWRLTSAVPPGLIAALPALPVELQYRFIGADLVIVDVHAGVVADILRGAAMPVETTIR